MTDKIVYLDHFKVLKKLSEDEDDREWIEAVLATLDQIKLRVQSGETAALMIVELHDEIQEWQTHLLGMADFDHLTVAGIFEMTKLGLLNSIYDE